MRPGSAYYQPTYGIDHHDNCYVTLNEAADHHMCCCLRGLTTIIVAQDVKVFGLVATQQYPVCVSSMPAYHTSNGRASIFNLWWQKD
jgi:hypothetical protein